MSPTKKPPRRTAPASASAAAATARGDIVMVPAVAEAAPRPGARPEGTYVYGVIASTQLNDAIKGTLGTASAEVYTVGYADIAAVVSATPTFIFDPTRDHALAHEHVVETVMRKHTIIPMSFGTVFRTDDDVRSVLRSIYPTLKKALKKLAGKAEFGLKVTWDRDRIIEELKREHDDIRRFHQELTRKSLQSAYFARMQLGRMVDQALAELAASYVREIYEGLRPVAEASRDSRPIGDKMLLNASFLVAQSREEEFDAAVNRMAQKLGDRLHFKATGPWPPYNFVNIHLKVEKGRTGS
jgi:Gas vesicle synthesis protein GvpL/GvpF